MGSMWNPRSIARLLADLGGIASARELYPYGLDAQNLRIAHDYDSLRRIRRGWYAHPEIASPIVHAWAWSGLLTCRSAREFGTDPYRQDAHLTLPLHICVRANSPIASRPLSARSTVPVVIHWETLPEHDDEPDRRSPRRLIPTATTIARHESTCDRERAPTYCRPVSRVRHPPSAGWLPETGWLA